jgi:hypothetical protein
MKTFDCKTTIPYPTFSDDEFLQDESQWAAQLFGSWFSERELAYGTDYHLARCKDGNVLVCFNDAGEALWFKSNQGGAA